MGWRDRLHIFRFWANKVLPQVYDDALSYYEVLNKVAAFLNETIEKMNELIQEMEDFEDDMTNKWNAFKEQMETDWANFQEEMKDDWKAYKVLMEETWNDFKDEINQSIQTWESETYTRLVAQLQSDIATVENNLREELERYIDGTRTVVIHVRNNNNVIIADKTYTEIRALLTTGSYFIAEYVNEFDDSEYYRLDLDQGTSIQFRRITFIGEVVSFTKYVRSVKTTTISVSSNNEWNVGSEVGTVLPNVQNALPNQVLRLNENKQMVWGNETSDLPTIQTGDANKVLKVNAQGTGVEWSTESGGALPPSTSTDEGKVLTVDSNGDAQWDTLPVPTEIYKVDIISTQTGFVTSQSFTDILNAIIAGKTIEPRFETGANVGYEFELISWNPGSIVFAGHTGLIERVVVVTITPGGSTSVGYISNLPAPTSGDEGKTLKVNSLLTPEWASQPTIPTPSASDYGSFIGVSSSGNYGLYTPPQELPSHSVSDAGKVLSISAVGTLEWNDIPNSEYSEASYYQAQDVYILDKTYDEILSELNNTPNGIVIKYTYNQITTYYNVVKTDGNQGFIEAICTTQTTPPNTSSQDTWDGWGVLTLTVLQITAGSGNAEAHLYNHYLHGFNPQNPPT